MNKTLRELRAECLPVATCDSISLNVKPTDDSEESLRDTAGIIAELNSYLSSFVDSKTCPGCRSKLGGFLGAFTWGIANGEGFCSICQYPARAYHKTESVSGLDTILAYHPRLLVAYSGSPEYEIEKAEAEATKLRLEREFEESSDAT